MEFDEWRLAILIANDLAKLLESEPGQEDAVEFMQTEILKSLRVNQPVVGCSDIAYTFENYGELVSRHPDEIVMSEADMWRHKRENQLREIEGLKTGALTSDDVNWFAGGIARKAKRGGSLI